MTRYLLPAYFCIFLTVSLPCFAAGGQQPVISPSRTIATNDLTADGRALEPVLSAGLRPELVWKRTSPNSKALEGPVLYQLLLNASGTPGTVPVFDTNPRHLINSPISVGAGNVAIGGLLINSSGIISFADKQIFPTSGLPNLAGEVTGPPSATVVSSAVSANNGNAIVRRDSSGNFLAGTITLSGALALSNTTSAAAGVVTLGGTPFLHNFGMENTFAGASAGNMSLTGIGNSAFGYRALSANTTGTGNSAFGRMALFFNTTGDSNSAFGYGALGTNTTACCNSAFGHFALSNSTGSGNSAFGDFALVFNTTGVDNSAVGAEALRSNTAGSQNDAFGTDALRSNTTGSSNEGFGWGALHSNTTGDHNSALGDFALYNLTSGTNNLALGTNAGLNLLAGESNNIYIGNAGNTGESNTIRIGDGFTQTAAFMTGISGATSGSGVAVFVNSSGQLGTATSARRFKQDIADLGAESDILMKLRPVAFYYKPDLDSTHTRQYGLVAEEVAQVAPSLVVFDKDGQPQTVRYHFVNAMLLNEVQKQRQLIEQQQEEMEQQLTRNEEQQATIARQQAEIQSVQQQLSQMLLRLAAVEKSVQPGTGLASVR